jgi:hypothetical protein
MPAYRSEAEAEVREAVVTRLRAIRPTARIMHEINVSSFGNRVDVLAVDRAEIIAVEIKSAKDKLDRLPDQVKAMTGIAHHTFAALHEKFFIETPTNPWRSEYERDGQHYYLAPPDNRIMRGYEVWRYPEHPKDRWRNPDPAIQRTLPANALDMLWRDELLEMCGKFSVSVPKRPFMGVMKNALRWQLSGRDLTLGICAALRSRACIEADPRQEAPIEGETP